MDLAIKWSPLKDNNNQWVELGIIDYREATRRWEGVDTLYSGDRSKQIGPVAYTPPEDVNWEDIELEYKRLQWRGGVGVGPISKVSPLVYDVKVQDGVSKTKMCLNVGNDLSTT